MQARSTGSNPFILMMDPASVFQAIERSERLARLSGRICRPLDQYSGAIETDSCDGSEDDAGVELDDQPT